MHVSRHCQLAKRFFPEAIVPRYDALSISSLIVHLWSVSLLGIVDVLRFSVHW
jgi:hypothetical protein